MSNLEDRVAIITGAAGILGAAVTHRMTAAGARVALVDLEKEIFERTFGTSESDDDRLFLSADLTRRDACRDCVDRTLARFGRLDIVANIAGGFTMGEAVHETSDETWDYMIGLNARTVLNMAAAAVPHMLAQGSGRIVNVGAMGGLRGGANMGAYSASKSAVMRLTESMSEELKHRGINVNAVLPSIIDTPRNREDMPQADFSRWVDPDDLASVITFLASDDARAVHGALIPVTGLV